MKHIDLTAPPAQAKSDDARPTKSSGAEPDPAEKRPNPASDSLGDDASFVKSGVVPLFDQTVTVRWVTEILESDAATAADVIGDPCDLDADEVLANASESMRRGFAMQQAWKLLAKDGQARAGDLLDFVDLFCAGRGSPEELAEAVGQGIYRSGPRDEDGRVDYMAIRLTEIAAEEAAQKAGIFSMPNAIDILERNLRCGARRLASTARAR